MNEIKVTIFTATYNRGYIIESLYKSLQRQTVMDFEWIVVDDGSCDNTEEIFSAWAKQSNEFKIIYKKVTNGGKHKAINIGLDMANSPLFFIVDSDDFISDDAIEKIIDMESTVAGEKNYAGISGLRLYFDGRVIGGCFNPRHGNYVDALNTEREQYKLTGDKAEVYYTEILRENKFPEFEGENFLPECVIWNQIAEKGYKIRWFNQGIYFCEYLPDGLSKAAHDRICQCPNAYRLWANTIMKHTGLWGKIKMVAVYSHDVYQYQNDKRVGLDLGVNPLFVQVSKQFKIAKDVFRKIRVGTEGDKA